MVAAARVRFAGVGLLTRHELQFWLCPVQRDFERLLERGERSGIEREVHPRHGGGVSSSAWLFVGSTSSCIANVHSAVAVRQNVGARARKRPTPFVLGSSESTGLPGEATVRSPPARSDGLHRCTTRPAIRSRSASCSGVRAFMRRINSPRERLRRHDRRDRSLCASCHAGRRLLRARCARERLLSSRKYYAFAAVSGYRRV